jgi:hypothetical protein
VPSRGDQEEQSLFVKRTTRDHSFALNKKHDVAFRVSVFENSSVGIQVIEWDQKDAFEFAFGF